MNVLEIADRQKRPQNQPLKSGTTGIKVTIVKKRQTVSTFDGAERARIRQIMSRIFWKIYWNYYKGGYQSQRNAPFSQIDEWEFGLERQFSKALELVTMYTITDRTNTRAVGRADTRSYEQFAGQLLRFQVQVND